MITPITNGSTDLLLNDRWIVTFRILDDDGRYVDDATPTVTSTDPSGNDTVETAEFVSNGIYRAAVGVDEAGRWIVVVEASGYGAASFAAYVSDVTDGDAFPDLAAVKSYLANGSEATSFSDAVVQDALDAEAAAQRRKCNVPAIYPPDLAQALKRRVARNLAMQGLPIAVLQGDSESGSLTLPGSDPEVRRLEGPHRKLVQPCP